MAHLKTINPRSFAYQNMTFNKKDSLLNLNEHDILDEEKLNDLESQYEPLISELDSISVINLRWYQSKTAVIFLCSLTLFIDMAGYGVVVPILPDYIIGKLHMNADMLGLLFASYAFGQLLATPVVSYIADKYHDRKYCMLFGMTGLFLSTLFFASSTSYSDLLIARFVQGVSSSCSWTTSLALCADVCINDLGKNMGLVFSFNSVGFLFGPILGGVLYDYYGFQMPFYVLSVLCILGIISRLIVDESILTQIKIDWLNEQTERDSQESSSLWSVVSDKRVLLGLTIVIITESILAGIEPVLPLFLHDNLGLAPSHIGLFMVLAALPNVLFASKIGGFSESYGELKTIIYGLLALMISSIVMGFCNSVLFSSIAVFVFGTCLYVANVPALGYCGKTSSSYGSIYGSFSLAFAFASFIGPALSSVVYDRLGFMCVCLLFSIASGLLAIVCFISLKTRSFQLILE
eukprot:NODE_157_length_16664_cov_0.301781.p3 type:complete len:463 gc:universal NODE_157_length_16664_cov_0.301781:2063-3451(+)